jgi:hypothetical protein
MENVKKLRRGELRRIRKESEEAKRTASAVVARMTDQLPPHRRAGLLLRMLVTFGTTFSWPGYIVCTGHAE